MSEFQRLRCRVAFHALLGHQMVERYNFHLPFCWSLKTWELRAWGRPFLAYHPDTLAYHGCAELFQDVHTELIQYRRAQMIKQGIIKEKISVDSHLHRKWFSCLESSAEQVEPEGQDVASRSSLTSLRPRMGSK
ncbi:hypothetical protein V6N11_071903 [Hibiscus sabdariffa]|uniref:Uncharacterized protein n=1 Tax=Hibiscus sabdariffa TaxID=183260 RepID=A0ABR2U270_9ROSI